jgi:hypothetical protein
MIDVIDNILGSLNFIDLLFGKANRLRHASRGGRFGPTVTIRLKRIDKGGDYVLREVIGHLNRHGVPTFDHAYDAQYRYFKVRKTQAAWARWLYNDGNLRSPQRAWKGGNDV